MTEINDKTTQKRIAALEKEIMELREALDTAELKNPITKEEDMLGVILDLKDRQWQNYCRDERTW